MQSNSPLPDADHRGVEYFWTTARSGRKFMVGVGVLCMVIVPALNCGATADHEAVKENVVSLPPFQVMENSRRSWLNSPPAWRYVRGPGVEMISQTPDDVSALLLKHYVLLESLLEMILPPQFQAARSVPDTFVTFDQRMHTAVPKEIVAVIEEREVRNSAPTSQRNEARWSVRELLNCRFRDLDSTATFAVLDDAAVHGNLTLSISDVRTRLERVAPALPAWFIDGFLAFYQRVRLESGLPPGSRQLNLSTLGAETPVGEIQVLPLEWVSAIQTQVAKSNDALSGVRMMPLKELFSRTRATHRDPLWQCEMVLFFRWAMDAGNGEDRRVALWKFVGIARDRPVTEDGFRECFGLSFGMAERLLVEYLPTAVRRPFFIPVNDQTRFPRLKFRDATSEEVGRIRGEYERQEIPYVAAIDEGLRSLYAGQARHTLAAAYDRGSRDPQLLASLGLCEIEAGNDEKALPFLELAARAGTLRPRAYYELGRIRFTQASRHAGGKKLDPTQVQNVIAQLNEAQRRSPPFPEVYQLMAQVWLQSESAPTIEDLRSLNEGLRLYPHRTSLIEAVALVYWQRGDLEEFHHVIDYGIQMVEDEPARQRLREFESSFLRRP